MLYIYILLMLYIYMLLMLYVYILLMLYIYVYIYILQHCRNTSSSKCQSTTGGYNGNRLISLNSTCDLHLSSCFIN